MLKPTSIFRLRSRIPASSGAFTLLEMIVAMAVLVIAMVLVTQITSSTVNTAQQSHRVMDVSIQARNVLDRLSAHLNSAATTGGMTVAVVKDIQGAGTGSSPKYNDGIAFIANARANSATVGNSPPGLLRSTVVGYRVETDTDPGLGVGGAGIAAPMLKWGSLPLAFPGGTSGAATDMLQTLTTAVSAVQASGNAKTFPFETLAPNIFRFEVSLLLSDGTIVGTPQNIPYDKDLQSKAASGTSAVCYLALSKESSIIPSATAPSFVRALIVGIAGLSGDVRQLVGSSKLTSLADGLLNPSDGATPIQTWSVTGLSPSFPARAQVVSNVRFYQRYYYLP
jgi:prepilin-type N-terminal cleavage/methylation domain-containing protein